MYCDCNENSFNKLRESWSRHHRRGSGNNDECNCCKSNLNKKSKVKGKFGLAYVIDTPQNKCKPCGWEVEFSDTPSRVEHNCKKMLNWVTCPPLGDCQNNKTNMCCYSEDAKQLLKNLQQKCCQCTKKQEKCCCQQKKNTCCKNLEQQDECNTERSKCCSNFKAKCSCCRAMEGQRKYMESIKKCVNCCCKTQNNDNIKKTCCCQPKPDECCCNNSRKKPMCCCYESDSSSDDCCNCQKYSHKDKTQESKDCACNCNCPACNCLKNKLKHSKEDHSIGKKNGKSKHRNNDKSPNKGTKNQKDKEEKNAHNSKNLNSQPQKMKDKITARTPYTISNSDTHKKEPDKENFYEELNRTINQRKEANPKNIKTYIDKKNETNIDKNNETNIDKNIVTNVEKKIETNNNKNIEANIDTSVEDTADPLVNTKDLTNDEVDIPAQEEIELKTLDYDNLGRSFDQIKPFNDEQFKPEHKLTLLEKIRYEHKKELQAIHPNNDA